MDFVSRGFFQLAVQAAHFLKLFHQLSARPGRHCRRFCRHPLILGGRICRRQGRPANLFRLVERRRRIAGNRRCIDAHFAADRVANAIGTLLVLKAGAARGKTASRGQVRHFVIFHFLVAGLEGLQFLPFPRIQLGRRRPGGVAWHAFFPAGIFIGGIRIRRNRVVRRFLPRLRVVGIDCRRGA